VILLPATRDEKEEQVARLTEQFRKSQVIVWSEYRGMKMTSLNGLRKAMRPHHGEFHVVKNTLAELALQRAGLPVPEAMLKGPTGATVVYDDIAAAIRALSDFAITNREFVIKGGQAGQRTLQPAEVSTLAMLPSREVLLAQVLGGMKAPVTGLVTVLGGTIRGLLNVLQAQAKKMEEAGA
jgi:large subunit ribosomal protein L10